MPVEHGGHRDAAVAAVAAREYERAGNEYTRAGRRVLSEPRPEMDPFEADPKGWVGRGLSFLVCAAVSYRVAGRSGRATRRGVEGVAAAKDLRTALEAPGQEGCLLEFVADFRVAGGLDGVEDAYAAAESAYETAADDIEAPRSVATTPLFQAAATPLKQAARGPANGEIAVTWEDLHGSDPSAPEAFLGHRARYKRRRFPSVVDQAIEAGHLAAPRGTTEYDNGSYRCPACGSSDVNWVGDSVLCLRCSRPMERR